MTEWFEDDQIWESMYPFMFPAERFEAAEEQVSQLLRLVEFEGQDVLDLACGPGRHAIALGSRGFRVTGVDRSPFLLAKAEDRAKEQGVEVEWVLQDMREFVRADSYDLAINMFTSFGFFDEKSDDLMVLRNMHRSLREDGALVIDVVGKEWLARHFQPTSASDGPGGIVVVNRREIFDDWTRIRIEWIVVDGQHAESYKFHHTIYSGQELRDRLLLAGFREVRLYGDVEGNEYGPEARRLVAIARR